MLEWKTGREKIIIIITVGRKILAKVKIQRGIFQGDALSPLLFVITMMSHILIKCTGGYKLYKSQEKNQPPIIHGQHQTIFQKGKKSGNPNTSSEDIQWRYRDGILQRKLYHANNDEQKTANDKMNRTTKSRKRRTLEVNETYSGILKADTIKQVEMKEKNNKEYLGRTRTQLETKLRINLIK